MKNKNLFIFIVLFSFFALFEFNVYALYFPPFFYPLDEFGNLSDSNNSDYIANSYNYDLAIYDPFGYDLPTCSSDLYVREYDSNITYIVSDSNSFSNSLVLDNLCRSSFSPDLDILYKYFPYVVRFNYKDILTGNVYYLYYLFSDLPRFVEYSTGIYLDSSSAGFTFSNLPNDLVLDSNNNIIVSNRRSVNHSGSSYSLNYYSQSVSSPLYYGVYEFNENHNIHLWDLNNNNYIETTISTNFDFSLINNYNLFLNSNYNVVFNYVDSFEFGTDLDLSIKYNQYLLLIPKKNSSFNGYFWSDSNFVYKFATYNSIDSSYTILKSGGLDSIAFNALNEYKFFKWSYSFSNDDLNKVLMIYNHNDSSILNIKIFSEDFYYHIFDENSSSYIINNNSYPNDWNSLHDISLNHSINNTYSNDSLSSSFSFLNNIPNYINSFKDSFVLIGLIFTTFFSLLSNDLLIYFYILFGLVIIMLIFNIMK